MVGERFRWAVFFASALLLACGVESTGKRGEGAGDVERAGACPRGGATVLSDYVSTQVALVGLEGETRTGSLISTASAETDGLAYALSGDVALPSTAPRSGRVVVLDRFGTNVITWIDPASSEVLGQLPVGTGFESNPQDYLELDDDLALVSRWGQNEARGAEDYDDGGDLLLIDTEKPEILGNVVLPAPEDLPARPAGLARVGSEIIVTLERLALDFSETGEAMLVGVSSEEPEVKWRETLGGHKSCGRAEISPDGRTLAVACSGELGPNGEVKNLDESALLLFDAGERPLEEVGRFSAEEVAGEPLQSSVAFASDSVVLLKTQTPWGGSTNNRLLALDLKTGETETLVEAHADEDGNGKGIVYAGLLCAPGCSDVCLMSDADAGVLQRVRIDEDGSIELLSPVTVEDEVGLPPVGLGHW